MHIATKVPFKVSFKVPFMVPCTVLFNVPLRRRSSQTLCQCQSQAKIKEEGDANHLRYDTVTLNSN